MGEEKEGELERTCATCTSWIMPTAIDPEEAALFVNKCTDFRSENYGRPTLSFKSCKYHYLNGKGKSA